MLCPCGSEKAYETCCGLYLEHHQVPETPEQLMRSRYTAYSLNKAEYIKQTMRGKALIGFDELEMTKSLSKVIWLKLEVHHSYLDNSDKGFVEFSASYLERNQLKIINELSEFHRINHVWYYVDGNHQSLSHLDSKQIIARNASCPCGSGKKFKNCHEK